MKVMRKYVAVGLFAVVLSVFFCSFGFAADTLTVTGTINENYQLVADNGETYEVEINDVGNEMAEHVGTKVKVTGIVEEVDGSKTIIPESFEVVEPKS